jgi:streptogramin lyase
MFGRVYDQAGLPVTQRLTVTIAPAAQPGAPFATAHVIAGSYRVLVPADAPDLLVSVQGEGYATRQRLYTQGRLFWPDGVNLYQVNPKTFDFGGPANSEDPDAPAYFMPAVSGNGTMVPANLMLPFENTRVTTLATDPAMHNSSSGGLAVGHDGRVVVAEEGANWIYEIPPGGPMRVLAGGPHEGDQTLIDGQGPAARFYQPTDIALDAAGNAYVADTSNSAIRKVSPDGTVTTFAGGRGYGHADGIGAEAKFHGPSGVAFDSHQNLFVVDRENACVRKIAPDGTVTTFAGARDHGYRNGPGAQARFRRPSRLAIDGADNLYVIDGGNHRIRKITPNGTVSDVYGSPTNRADGAAVQPALNLLETVAVDVAGNLYTTSDFRVYKIAPSGDISIMAGYGLEGHEDGDARSAKFRWLSGLALGPNGSLYVHESAASRVRHIQPLK